ncbi:MAG: hypothetical protein U0703_30400, partial [Anaerolineae bacterium]
DIRPNMIGVFRWHQAFWRSPGLPCVNHRRFRLARLGNCNPRGRQPGALMDAVEDVTANVAVDDD